MKRAVGLLLATSLLPAAIYAQVVAYDYSKLYEKAAPALTKVRPSRKTPLPVICRPPCAVVVPVPLIVPPLHTVGPLIVKLPVPVRVPPDCVKELLICESLMRVR